MQPHQTDSEFCQIDDIFIGDSEASLDTFKNIQAYQETKKMNIKCF